MTKTIFYLKMMISDHVNKLWSNLANYFMNNPYSLIYYFAILGGVVIRLVLSLSSYGLLHPDEIFQSLEIAHFLVYGTGYIPPEFQSEFNLIESYAASRSWLFPMIFAAIMRIGEFVGINYFTGTLVLIKIFLALNASLIIPVSKKFVEELTQDEKTGIIAAIIIAFWFRYIQFSVRSFSNTFFLPYIFFGLYLVLKSMREESLTISNVIDVGLLIGLVTYIRTDLGILVFSLFLVTFKMKYWKHYLLFVTSSAIFWVIGGLIDYRMYNGARFFSVPINWFTFNFIEGNSKIFGVDGPQFYIVKLIFVDGLILWILLILFWNIFWKRFQRNHEIPDNIITGFRTLSLTTLITWIIYSNPWITIIEFSLRPLMFEFRVPMTHKEVRFIMGGLIFLLNLIAIFIRLFIFTIDNFSYKFGKLSIKLNDLLPTNKLRRRQFIAGFILTIFLVHTSIGIKVAMFNEFSEDINYSLIYLGQDKQVQKVVIVENWFLTGYYTYSHFNEEVEFTFLPLHDNQSAERNYILLKGFISKQNINSFILVPDYQYTYADNLKGYLTSNGYILDNEIGTVDVWEINSQ